MNLHNAKRVAFLQLCNWVSASDLTHIKDLFDGEFFLNVICTTFGVQYDSVAAVSEKDKINGEEESKTPSESEDAEAKNKIILEKFKFIQKFLNEKYVADTSEVISYSDCAQGNEFELAKVIIFILSEVVRHFVNTNNDHFKTLSHLEVKVQEDLEECFRVFISDRKSISKSKVEKLLSSHARYKALSPSKSSYITPRRSCASKYRLSSPTNEELITNSPLKSFFESPVFKKEDILLKEKEIVKTRSNLHEVEIKCDELQFELKEAKKKLKEKDKEIQKLKANRIKQGSDEKKYEEEIIDENERLKNEIEQIQREHEFEMAQYVSRLSVLEIEAREYGRRKSYREADETLEKLLLNKDILLDKLKTKIEYFKSEVERLENEIERKDQELAEKDEQLEEVKFDLLKNESIYLEKLSEFKEAIIKEESQLPVSGENVGRIYEEENRILNLRVKELEEQIKQLEEQMEKYEMVQPEEIPVPDTKNAFNVSMPVLLNGAKPPEAQKLEDLKKHSKKDEEFSGLPDECDFSSNSEVASKHSAASSHSEARCLQESPFTENTPEPVLHTYGTLWKILENSQLESERSDTLENLNGYSQGNLLNKSCCHCNKIHLESESEIIKTTAIQLEKKEEEIDKLKSTLETVNQVLNANTSTIVDLKTKLEEESATCKKLQEKVSRYRESLQSERAKLKEYDRMREKVKLIDYEKKKLEKIHNEELEGLRASNMKKEKEKYVFLMQINNLNKLYKSLQIQMSKLESQKSQLLRQLKTAEESSLQKTKELEYLKACMEHERKRQDESQNWRKSDSFFVEFNAGASKDICNESTLSGALGRKNGFQFISHDEADFLNQSSLEDLKKDYKEERMGELLRRNSIVPRHLKSSYPIEMNLSLSTDKFYMPQKVDSAKNEIPGESEQHSAAISKKRKLNQDLDYDVRSELANTPLAKLRKSFKTPTSLRKLLNRNHRKGLVTPKPS